LEAASKKNKAKVKAEPKAAGKAKAEAAPKRSAKAVKAEVKTESLKGNHKYKDEDGRLDRKKNGYYDLKKTWESSGQARKAHSGEHEQVAWSLREPY
jgi:hypothetical protein